MSYRLIVSSRALEQLWTISCWYAKKSRSPEIGLGWYSGFHAALHGLTENPLSCPLARESDLFPFDVRELHYGSGRHTTHRALFRLTEDRIEVLAICHHAQQDATPGDIELP